MASVIALTDLVVRLRVLEAESAIRRLMAEYLAARDRDGDPARLAQLFTPDAIWEGTGGFAATLGVHRGQAAIARRTVASRARTPFSAHFLANESIVVDGDTATGMWTFLQCAVSDGQALWIAGCYRNDFRRLDGAWRIAHLRVEDLFVAPYAESWLPYVSAKPVRSGQSASDDGAGQPCLAARDAPVIPGGRTARARGSEVRPRDGRRRGP